MPKSGTAEADDVTELDIQPVWEITRDVINISAMEKHEN